MAEALAQYDDCGTFLFPHGGGMQMDAFKQAKASGELPATIGIQDTTDACQMHALRQTGVVHVITGFTHFDGLDAERITRSIADGRRMAFVVTEVYRKYIARLRQRLHRRHRRQPGRADLALSRRRLRLHRRAC